MKRKNTTTKWIKHYSSDHKILLVGEGDFSFAACLATSFGDASNIVATSLDSKAEMWSKYSKAITNLEKLESLGCVVIHQVNAHTMSQHPLLQYKLFDRIVFNFPHATLLYKEHDPLQIGCHQELVSGFMKSARYLMARGGEVHVTHKTCHPYSAWEIYLVALNVGLQLVEAPSFSLSDYPGYVNKRGYAPHFGRTFRVGACRTFVFQTIRWPKEQQDGMENKVNQLLDEKAVLTSNMASLEEKVKQLENNKDSRTLKEALQATIQQLQSKIDYHVQNQVTSRSCLCHLCFDHQHSRDTHDVSRPPPNWRPLHILAGLSLLVLLYFKISSGQKNM